MSALSPYDSGICVICREELLSCEDKHDETNDGIVAYLEPCRHVFHRSCYSNWEWKAPSVLQTPCPICVTPCTQVIRKEKGKPDQVECKLKSLRTRASVLVKELEAILNEMNCLFRKQQELHKIITSSNDEAEIASYTERHRSVGQQFLVIFGEREKTTASFRKVLTAIHEQMMKKAMFWRFALPNISPTFVICQRILKPLSVIFLLATCAAVYLETRSEWAYFLLGILWILLWICFSITRFESEIAMFIATRVVLQSSSAEAAAMVQLFKVRIQV